MDEWEGSFSDWGKFYQQLSQTMYKSRDSYLAQIIPLLKQTTVLVTKTKSNKGKQDFMTANKSEQQSL